MVGVLGLASMGLAISLSQLSESVIKGTGPGPEIPIEAYTPPAIPQSDFEQIIEQNSISSEIVTVEGRETRYTINWDQIKNNLANLPKVRIIFYKYETSTVQGITGGLASSPWPIHRHIKS